MGSAVHGMERRRYRRMREHESAHRGFDRDGLGCFGQEIMRRVTCIGLFVVDA